MHWRKATWALAIFNVLMLIWLIAGIASTGGNATNCGSLDQQTCNAAANVGTGIAVTMMIIIWFIGFVVFSLIWLMSRPHRRQCPACGQEVKRGLTTCQGCGHSFVPSGTAPVVQAAGGGAPTISPDGKYSWNGQAWMPISPPAPPIPTLS
jgi:hypothetical protein